MYCGKVLQGIGYFGIAEVVGNVSHVIIHEIIADVNHEAVRKC